jgi:hypothetical protein
VLAARRWLSIAAVPLLGGLAALGTGAHAQGGERAVGAPAHRGPDLPATSSPAPHATAALQPGCAAGPDADADGLSDGCEHALALAFAPELVVDAGECSWRADARPPRPDGAYLYAVRPTAGRAVRIAYLPAYAEDCGWAGPKCLLTGPMCRGHAGDSELVLVDAAYDAARRRWKATAVFLSAHCHGTLEDRCRWYRGTALDRFAWVGGAVGGAPVVWVATGTHANYPTRRSCDRGFWNYDSCDRNRVRLRFPVLSAAQNAGSRHRPFGGRTDAEGCIPAPMSGPDGDRRECIWSVSGAFHGWRPPSGEAPTPYGRHLRDYGGF